MSVVENADVRVHLIRDAEFTKSYPKSTRSSLPSIVHQLVVLACMPAPFSSPYNNMTSYNNVDERASFANNEPK